MNSHRCLKNRWGWYNNRIFFFLQCISRWLQKGGVCPLCRTVDEYPPLLWRLCAASRSYCIRKCAKMTVQHKTRKISVVYSVATFIVFIMLNFPKIMFPSEYTVYVKGHMIFLLLIWIIQTMHPHVCFQHIVLFCTSLLLVKSCNFCLGNK